jgi:serine/threonine protein kinase
MVAQSRGFSETVLVREVPSATHGARPLPVRLGGRYELLHELASGGMATVFLGRIRGAGGFGRLVAVKCCHRHLRYDEDFARMFLDEARLVAELRHPNVVGTLDFGEDDEHALFIVMEFVDGYSLLELQRAARSEGQRIPTEVSLRLVIDALQGLGAAHEHTDARGAPLHIVHRDVSPQNIMVGVDGVARIMDFGIARAESRLTHTRDGNIKGKAAYMAPEQHGLLMENPPPLTHRADLFSMGVVLWESLTGKRLFLRDNDAQTLAASIRGEVTPASESASDVSPALDAAITRALSQNPDQRWPSATAMIEALETCGVRPASTREVRDWIRATIPAKLEERAALLRRFAEVPSNDDAEVFIDRVLTSATNAALQQSIAATGAIPLEAQGEEIELDVIASSPPTPPRAQRRLGRWIAAVALVLVVGFASVLALRPTAAVTPTEPGAMAPAPRGAAESVSLQAVAPSSPQTPSDPPVDPALAPAPTLEQNRLPPTVSPLGQLDGGALLHPPAPARRATPRAPRPSGQYRPRFL